MMTADETERFTRRTSRGLHELPSARRAARRADLRGAVAADRALS